MHHVYVYDKWRSERREHKIIARIKDNDSPEASKRNAGKFVYADAGVDFFTDVLTQPADGTRSYDKDGFIVNAIWDFGDGSPVRGLPHS